MRIALSDCPSEHSKLMQRLSHHVQLGENMPFSDLHHNNVATEYFIDMYMTHRHTDTHTHTHTHTVHSSWKRK